MHCWRASWVLRANKRGKCSSAAVAGCSAASVPCQPGGGCTRVQTCAVARTAGEEGVSGSGERGEGLAEPLANSSESSLGCRTSTLCPAPSSSMDQPVGAKSAGHQVQCSSLRSAASPAHEVPRAAPTLTLFLLPARGPSAPYLWPGTAAGQAGPPQAPAPAAPARGTWPASPQSSLRVAGRRGQAIPAPFGT